jgi:hypothetical protein
VYVFPRSKVTGRGPLLDIRHQVSARSGNTAARFYAQQAASKMQTFRDPALQPNIQANE